MRGLGDLDHVVHPRGVVAAFVERDHGRIEQLAHGPPALAAQDPLAGRGADGVGIAVGPSSRPVACAVTARVAPFPAVTFLAAGDRTGFFGAGAGSRWTLGDPMPGAW